MGWGLTKIIAFRIREGLMGPTGLVPVEVSEKPFKHDCRLLVEFEILGGLPPDGFATEVTVRKHRVILPSHAPVKKRQKKSKGDDI